MADEIRRLAAIMFTDIAGYTAITQSNEALAQELLKEHDEILRPIFIKWKGNVVKTIGDCFLVEFVNALDSVRCALDIQENLYKRNQSVSPDRKFHIRIGIHIGDVIYRDNDVFGDGVNIASRVQELAESGGICLTEDIVRQVRNKIEAPIVSLGSGELKHIKLEVAIFKILLPWKQKKLTMTEKIGRVLKSKTFLWSAVGLFILGIGLTVLTKFGYINLAAGELKPNPEMKFSEIKIPFKNVGAPGFSDDGNVMAFSAPDINGKYDIYLMYLSTKQYKRITFDSSDLSSDVVLSRDGSLILDQRTSYCDSLELSIISSLGNGKKIVLGKGSSLARITPDNQIIGFIKPDTHDRPKEFWTVRPDGTDKKLIFTDSVGGYHSFAWSNDGKNIVWIKSFNEDTIRYEEIVIHNLSTGEEKQLTNLRAPIYEVEWSDDNLIYFTSPGHGNEFDFRPEEYELWAIPASGGKPVRITSGSGADNVIRFANKAERMFMHKRDDKFTLWTADTDGKNQRQIIFDELSYYYAYFESADSIIAERYNGNKKELVRINTSSGEVEVLYSAKKPNTIFNNYRPVSPDLSKVAFSQATFNPNRPWDTCITYCCDNNYKILRTIEFGIPEFWLDEDKLVLMIYDPVDRNVRGRNVYAVSTASLEPFHDSASDLIFPIFNKSTLVIIDSTGYKFAAFRTKESMQNYLKNGGTASFKPLPVPNGTYLEPTSGLLLTEPEPCPDKYFAYTVPELQKIEIGKLPKFSTWYLSQDLNKVVYTTIESTSKVIAVDNITP